MIAIVLLGSHRNVKCTLLVAKPQLDIMGNVKEALLLKKLLAVAQSFSLHGAISTALHSAEGLAVCAVRSICILGWRGAAC